jgi:hypothetical protein
LGDLIRNIISQCNIHQTLSLLMYWVVDPGNMAAWKFVRRKNCHFPRLYQLEVSRKIRNWYRFIHLCCNSHNPKWKSSR